MSKLPLTPPSRQITTSTTIIILLLSFTGVLIRPTLSSSPALTEVNALLEFKSNLKDPLNYLSSWVPGDSPCQFFGVRCENGSGRVTEINLNYKYLTGTISPEIGNLRQLKSLILPSNYISGEIPASLANCTELKVLNLTANNMTGEVPELSGLINLEVFEISDNYFSGKLPNWIGKLTALTSLGLGDNNYEGSIPDNIGLLKNLNYLYLRNCALTGQIPNSLFELKELGTLDLARNKLSGEIPASIKNMLNLYKIELADNLLTGVIPPEIGALTLLQEIDVSRNRLTGELPVEIGNLKNLTVFECNTNGFTGGLPAGFGDMKYLKGFSIYRNNFSGEFPAEFGKFAPLVIFDISENNFSGELPRFLCRSGKLEKLLALDNKFSGALPESYAECKSLLRLRVNQNLLSGDVPDRLWGLPNVEMIDLSDNMFTGKISPVIGISTALTQLLLLDNSFSGQLPSEIGQLTSLEKIDFSNNKFAGEIPKNIESLKQLSYLHMENNMFSGSIPVELGECDKLVDLNLARNLLTGSIPDSLADMSSLNSLNLSRNMLTGVIPDNLRWLKLSSIDLSVNRLSGQVPSDLLNMGGDDAFLGNEKLCVNENSGRRVNMGLDVCDDKHHGREINKSKLVIFCVIIFCLMVLIGGFMYASYNSVKTRREKADTKTGFDEEKGTENPNWKLENFHQIEFDVDELCDLDEGNLIGVGGTGKVYRVESKRSGLTVAVKQIGKGNQLQVMAAEIGILGKIRHRNILKLYACLMKGGSSFLVFEHMVNGNLYEALGRVVKNGQPELDWVRRYKIACGAAKGIAYLHHDCTPAILHRDIKSSNILLDGDFEAKIADFGVARIADKECLGSDSNCFVGTHGYIAPELAYTLKVTEKSDIYSFGVVLLELVTGKRAIEKVYGEGKDIVYWVLSNLNNSENILKLLDPKLISNGTNDLAEDMKRVLKIALLCATKLPNLRPSMREVVKMLTDAEPGIGLSPTARETIVTSATRVCSNGVSL